MPRKKSIPTNQRKKNYTEATNKYIVIPYKVVSMNDMIYAVLPSNNKDTVFTKSSACMCT